MNAIVGDDGTFTAQTLRTEADGQAVARPGVPAGTYRVTYHPPGHGQNAPVGVELDQRVTVEPAANVVALILPPKATEPNPPKNEGK